MKLRRILSFMLVLILVCSAPVLTGCSKKSREDDAKKILSTILVLSEEQHREIRDIIEHQFIMIDDETNNEGSIVEVKSFDNYIKGIYSNVATEECISSLLRNRDLMLFAMKSDIARYYIKNIEVTPDTDEDSFTYRADIYLENEIYGSYSGNIHLTLADKEPKADKMSVNFNQILEETV